MATQRLLFHPRTATAISSYIALPGQALLVTGLVGSGKASTAQYIVSALLGIEPDDSTSYDTHPYIRIVRPIEAKAIPIESIRELQRFLSLQVPGTSTNGLQRAVVIEEAHTMTTEAQNALLKTLEEPPENTLIVMTAISGDSVLPTIQSRVQQLAVLAPATEDLQQHFTTEGYASTDIDRAILVSGELPGLMTALLHNDTEHPLVAATVQARAILQSKLYDRLLLVDELSKQKQVTADILYVLGQMSRTALLRSTDHTSSLRWKKVMTASYHAAEQLSRSSNAKLVLTDFMLSV